MIADVVFHFSLTFILEKKCIVTHLPANRTLLFFLLMYSNNQLYTSPWHYLVHSLPKEFNISLMKELYFMPCLNKCVFLRILRTSISEVQVITGVKCESSNQEETQTMKPDPGRYWNYFSWSELTALSWKRISPQVLMWNVAVS